MEDHEQVTVETDDGVRLAVERAGKGLPIVLLHGLTATRRYVVMGSRLIERSGHLLVAYDARGHGASSPAPDRSAYGYDRLAADLLCVLDALEIERATLVGASMGGHTCLALALSHPERVSALGVITPAFDPDAHPDAEDPGAFASWDALAAGLREGGAEGFAAAQDTSTVPERWRATVEQVMRQRLAAHEHPDAVADALEVVPRSRPFESIAQLAQIEAPTLVIASRDQADPGHPLAVGERYAAAIPHAKLLVEDEGASPIAWQGGQLSRALLELAAAVPS